MRIKIQEHRNPERVTGLGDEREKLTQQVDQQIAELQRIIDAQRAGAMPGDLQLQALEQRLVQLNSLRQDIAATRSATVLTQLTSRVNDAVRGAGDAVQAAASGPTGIQTSAGRIVISEAAYHASLTRIERDAAPLVQRTEQFASTAAETARRLGVDTSRFIAQNDALKQEAEQARLRGDRYGAIEANTLRAHNAANHWDAIASQAVDPKERNAAELHAREARANADRMEQQRRQALASEIERDAGRQGLANADARGEFVQRETQRREGIYQQRLQQLQQRSGSPGHRQGVAAGEGESAGPSAASPTDIRIRQASAAIDANLAEEPPAEAAKSTTDIPAVARNAARSAAAPAHQSGARPSEDTASGAATRPATTPVAQVAADQGPRR